MKAKRFGFTFKKGVYGCLLLFLSCCGKIKKYPSYEIALDPSWSPLELSSQNKRIFAFSFDLLYHIAKKEKITLSITSMSSDNLLEGLEKKSYDAILSSLEPYVFYQKRYSFSDPYLKTGPILVTSFHSEIKSLEEIKGKQIAVITGSSGAVLLQTYLGVIIKGYNSIPEALNALEREEVDGALVGVLLAQNYVKGLYQHKLKMLSPPLNNEGLRLITLHGRSPQLIAAFNNGLKTLKKSGEYEKLLTKWGLSPDDAQTTLSEHSLKLLFENISIYDPFFL